MLADETRFHDTLTTSQAHLIKPENRNLKMSESSNFVSVIKVENSELDPKPNNRSEEMPVSTNTVSITVDNSEPDSLSGKSASTVSISSASDASSETGVTNQAFVDDEDVTVHEKKGHQRSPSCSLGKDEKV